MRIFEESEHVRVWVRLLELFHFGQFVDNVVKVVDIRLMMFFVMKLKLLARDDRLKSVVGVVESGQIVTLEYGESVQEGPQEHNITPCILLDG